MIGAADAKFMKRAKELLFGELAAAPGIAKTSVPEYINAKINGKRREQPCM